MKNIDAVLYSMLIVMLIVLLAVMIFVATSYENHPESTQTLEVTTRPVSGKHLRMLSFTSTEYHFDQKQNEIRPKLEKMINDGWYNIVSVNTSHSHLVISLQLKLSTMLLVAVMATICA